MIQNLIDPYTGQYDDPLPIDLGYYSKAVVRLHELEGAYQQVSLPNGFATIRSGFTGPDGQPQYVTLTYADRARLKKAILALQPAAGNRVRYYF